jgi:hypothetical protein
MKFYANILALCALYPAADAFMVQPPKTISNSLKATYSYLGNLNDDKPEKANGSTTYASSTSQGFTAADASVTNGITKKASATTTKSEPTLSKYTKPRTTKEIFEEISPVTVQGGSLRTCSFEESVDRVSVYLKTEGRPLTLTLNCGRDLITLPRKCPCTLRTEASALSARPSRLPEVPTL